MGICSIAERPTLWGRVLGGELAVDRHYVDDGQEILVLRPGARSISERERQVIDLLASGTSSKAVGYDLGLAPSTVSTHVTSALAKLGVRTKVELIRLHALLHDAEEVEIDVRP
jgi:DNA-binding CsgD family transcriptional regulator